MGISVGICMGVIVGVCMGVSVSVWLYGEGCYALCIKYLFCGNITMKRKENKYK